jgi:hypothetical protein
MRFARTVLLTSSGRMTIRFDAAILLIRSLLQSTDRNDGRGRRESKTNKDSDLAWDGQRILQELESRSSVRAQVFENTPQSRCERRIRFLQSETAAEESLGVRAMVDEETGNELAAPPLFHDCHRRHKLPDGGVLLDETIEVVEAESDQDRVFLSGKKGFKKRELRIARIEGDLVKDLFLEKLREIIELLPPQDSIKTRFLRSRNRHSFHPALLRKALCAFVRLRFPK